ncbi:Rad9-domain-containing protein [Gymnopilus junonius]|uniref:Rad9-domain-containing protein n=1 Tax=Gymnopilus junonius TaxID=109634 RepID=A0A9P5N825_GYMJU|nr:Rad9-domain-containing protein [Gymnopilus junonius]
MQATLDASSLKVLIKSLTCLSKYGDELSIYATPEFLSFSSTNSSKSAYCRFKYDKQFFSRYKLGSFNNELGDNIYAVQNVTGQLLTKSFLSILKHRTVEKSVERCELSIVEGNGNIEESLGDDEQESLESKLTIRFHCKHGVIKTHRLLLLTPASLMAPGAQDTTNESRLTIGPKALRELLDHFPVSKGARSDPQLIWTFEENEISLRSMESSIDSRGRGQLSTEISISTEEFDIYDPYETPTVIAFHLREFNATIAFGDAMSLPLDMRFTDPAAPLYIDVEGDAMEILFVISTSHTPGFTTSMQKNSQLVNAKKREREQSTSETPRPKKPMKAAQPVIPKSASNRATSASRSQTYNSGSMPPPSVIPIRRGQSHGVEQDSRRDRDPLFLPSSQMSAADEEALRSIGLGVESIYWRERVKKLIFLICLSNQTPSVINLNKETF